MTREEAIARAREVWGEGEPYWFLAEDEAYFSGDAPGSIHYTLPSEPYWTIPLRCTRPSAGAIRAVFVFPESGVARAVRYGG